MNLPELCAAGHAFARRLAQAKLAAPQIVWYPYPTLSLMDVLPRVLAGHQDLFSQLEATRVLDLGCADGDLSFFLESLGYPVSAFDNPATSHNHGDGFRHLHAQLGSQVPLAPIDLDHPNLPSAQSGLAILLGVLYHLRNPYTILEHLAQRSRYLLTSTRVMRYSPDGRDLAGLPVAWFLDDKETNNDATNYWILTQAALERILRRAGWEILTIYNHGQVDSSDPVRADRDERVFCLARSRHFQSGDWALTRGWYSLEPGPFRWTEPEFAARIGQTPPAGTIELRFYLPAALTRPVTLQAFAGGRPLETVAFHEPGEHLYRARFTGAFQELRFRVTPSHHRPGEGVFGIVVPFDACPFRISA